ncbi:3,4-dihydroxy-2-butanone-4-phosphate synthase [Rhodococcus koreensis]|uniref:3,4-dihydroxy-2-butanone-4-phosphate synthase n=1 Tax=Rhodococcus koreensis TaxID=99653 RepID=UPI00366A64B8
MRELGARWPSVRDSVERAVAAIRSGRPVVVVDADRQNEGDLIFAAEHATTELLAFVIRHTSGFVCVALPADDCNRLGLPPMSYASGDKYAAAYRVSVDLRGRGTGISAADRATTIAALASSSAQSAHFTRPGHVVPLAARDGGVLQRPGRTEAAVDLARLAGLRPAGGLCEIVSTDTPSEMAHGPELERFAAEHGIEIVGIGDLVAYRRRTESQVRRHADAALPTSHGEFRAVGYRGVHDGAEHMALVAGDVHGTDVPVHVHTECLTGDVFGSTACDCRKDLDRGLATVAGERRGVIVYIRAQGRPYACGLSGAPSTGDSDRTDTVVASILADLEVTSVRSVHHEASRPIRIDRSSLRSATLAEKTSA